MLSYIIVSDLVTCYLSNAVGGISFNISYSLLERIPLLLLTKCTFSHGCLSIYYKNDLNVSCLLICFHLGWVNCFSSELAVAPGSQVTGLKLSISVSRSLSFAKVALVCCYWFPAQGNSSKESEKSPGLGWDGPCYELYESSSAPWVSLSLLGPRSLFPESGRNDSPFT